LPGTKQNVIARHEAKRHCQARSKTSLPGTKQNVIARHEAIKQYYNETILQ